MEENFNNNPDNLNERYSDSGNGVNSDGILENANTVSSLEEAYRQDKARKLIREDELQAARDYLNVLLQEMEGRNVELEGKYRETGELQERLARTEDEIRDLKNEKKASKRQKFFSVLWMCISIVELAVIIGLLIFFRPAGESNSDKADDRTDLTQDVMMDNEDHQKEEPAVLTLKFCDNLEERVRHIKSEQIAPFTCAVEKLDGLEYLTFTSPKVKVYFKNEYFAEDISFKKLVTIERNGERLSFKSTYDMNGDISQMCPQLSKVSNQEMLTFMEYNEESRTNIPYMIRLVAVNSLRLYESEDLEARIQKLMDVGIEEGVPGRDENSGVYSLKTSKASYRYSVEQGALNQLAYNEELIPDVDSQFSISVNADEIYWSTVVKLGEDMYLGKLWGNLSATDNGIGISAAKFGAFVQPNQENPEFNGLIVPSDHIPGNYLTVTGSRAERFLIPLSETVTPCGYDWSNLDTSDKNNWIFKGEDGSEISIRGIDVSKYQGNIDWNAVAKAGVKFAIIRLGYRGMNEGTLETDEYFVRNITEARRNGIEVGVYFFSQAIDEKEAVEEAEFVINAIRDYDVMYPVCFDTEAVTTYDARANGLSYEKRTDICIAFCDRIAAAGYKPMIYANTKYMLMGIDLERLGAYDKWFAYYSGDITFPYDFSILQYSESGRIPGIAADVDLNISFVDYAK